jgi:hypothetical protein
MYIFEKIRQEIADSRKDAGDEVLTRLMNALEQDEDFPIQELYDLNYSRFKIALNLLQEWRLLRHCRPTVKDQDAGHHGLTVN